MKTLSPIEREAYLMNLLEELSQRKITDGELLAKLRKEILGMNQEAYATFVGVSRRTLSDIENDSGKQTLSVANKVFKPFGLVFGLKLIREDK
jgi:DNA-binding XRE family transcriptional regulator